LECQELRGQNEQLQRQVAALQPLAGRVRALEGVGTEEGGRRQRRRVGPAPHDAPPSDAAIAAMGLAEALAALRAHVADARVAEKACKRLTRLSEPDGSEQAAAEAGMIEAAVVALRTHPQVACVQLQGLFGLHSLCVGGNAAERARAQRAAEAGCIEAVVAALRAHVHTGVPHLGCMLLNALCDGDDAAARARKQRAAVAGAIEAVLEAMRARAQDAGVQEYGCETLLTVCGGGASAAARARRQRAAQAGGRTVVVGAMQAHPGNRGVQREGQLVLNALPA